MKKRILQILIVLILISGPVFAITIKIGSVAPGKSPWDKALRELGREWKSISNGQIRMRIYPGGIAGSEEDMIRKMKVGILDGAVFTNRGLTKIYPDFYVLNIPFTFNSEEEFLHVAGKMNPIFEKGIEKEGYKVIIWSMAGWIRFFSEHPVLYPRDLKKHKLSFTTGEPEQEQVWKKSGYQVIPNEMSDLMMGLQSGMVNAFYLPPLVAASGQYFPLAPNMLDLKIAPIYGGIVLEAGVWEKIPDSLKQPLMRSAAKISSDLMEQTITLEEEAVQTMIKHGLKIHPVPEGSMKQWREASDEGFKSLINKVFSKQIYDLMNEYVKKYRKDKDAK